MEISYELNETTNCIIKEIIQAQHNEILKTNYILTKNIYKYS